MLDRLLASLVAITFATTPALAQKSLVANGGGCVSQGAWTGKAMEQTRLIYETAERLKNDPDCVALYEAVRNVPNASPAKAAAGEGENEAPIQRFETLPKELDALRAVLQNSQSNALNQRLTPVLVNSAVAMLTNAVRLTGPISTKELGPLKERMRRTSEVSMNVLQNVMQRLPQAEQCMHKRPDETLMITSAVIRGMAAFASSEKGGGSQLADLLADFANFMRQMKYAGVLKKLNQQKFWNEVSCLVETTQATYCSAQDGLNLLEYQSAELERESELRRKSETEFTEGASPLEGYMILQREIPTVAAWLQRVQFGVEPKLMATASFKNDIWVIITGLMTDINIIQGRYNQNLLVYERLQDLQAKQQNIRALITTLRDQLAEQKGSINFFAQAVPMKLLPFFLIGRESIPTEITAAGANRVDEDDYLQRIDLAPEFKNPDLLMVTVLDRLTIVAERALRDGSKYFAENMSVDQMNLADEAITNSAFSVVRSLKHVRNYILQLSLRYKHQDGGDTQIISSMIDTMARIDRVLEKFEEVRKASQEISEVLEKRKDQVSIAVSKEKSAQTVKVFRELINLVYTEFNLLLQQDSFLTQRLSTYVRFDIYDRVRRGENMSPYLANFLTIAGKSVLTRLQEFQGTNLAELESDLSHAQVTNRNSLDALEELVGDVLWDNINSLNKQIGEAYFPTNTSRDYNPYHWVNGIWGQRSKNAFIRNYGLMANNGFLANLMVKNKSQDPGSEARFVRAKLCTQTLAFEQWWLFEPICRGSTLQSRLTAKVPADLKLAMRYDQAVADKRMKFSFKGGQNGVHPEGLRYQHVCSLRDFFRNNQVYWMTLDFGK